jgi:hypothetical protein
MALTLGWTVYLYSNWDYIQPPLGRKLRLAFGFRLSAEDKDREHIAASCHMQHSSKSRSHSRVRCTSTSVCERNARKVFAQSISSHARNACATVATHRHSPRFEWHSQGKFDGIAPAAKAADDACFAFLFVDLPK